MRPTRPTARSPLPRAMRTAAFLLLILGGPLGAVDVGAGSSPAPVRWLGRPLIEALEWAQSHGLPLVFSSAVVPPGMTVSVEPLASDPRALLDEILPPLGLAAREGPGGVLLIVAADAGAGATGTIRGRILSSATGAPIVAARVRLPEAGRITLTRPDGAFVIAGLPVGRHALLADADGFNERTIDPVDAVAGEAAILIVRLDPRPAFVEQIVVTPGRHSLARDDPSLRLSIDHEEAALVPAIGGDVARTVTALPGVTAADNSSAFNLRGSETRDVSLVLDGLELYDPFHLEGFQSPFSLVDQRVVGTIDVLGGGFTVDRGDRRGGFVEMATDPSEGPERSRVEVGSVHSGFSYGAPTRSGSILLSARGWYPEAFRDTLELGEPGFEPTFADAYVKSSIVLSGRTLLSLHALLASDHLDFQEATGNEQATLDTKSAHLWLRLQQTWSAAFSTDTIVSAGRLNRVRQGDSEPEDEVITVDDERTVDFYGLETDAAWEATDTQMVRFGLQARPLQSEYRYASGPVSDPAAGTALGIDPSGVSIGLYAAHRAALTDRITTELGLRWDRQGWLDDGQWSPRLNALWRLGDRTDLRAGFGRYCQSQRIHELDVEDGTTTFAPAEISRRADLTLQHRTTGGLRLRFDGYYGTIDDVQPRHENLFTPIELFPETAPDRVLVAPDRARLRGVELLVGGPGDRRFYWWVGYTWSAADDVFDGESTARSWDQTHAGRFLVAYRSGDLWSVSLLGTARTGWPTTPVTAEDVALPGDPPEFEAVPGPRNSERFPWYLRVDLQARRTWHPAWGRLSLDLEVTNLTDRKNVCCVDEFRFETQPGGSVVAEPTLEHWLGPVLSFSLVSEF